MLPTDHPELAIWAKKIGERPLMMKNFEDFDKGNIMWLFTENTNLVPSINKPTYFPDKKEDLTKYLQKLDFRKKAILKDLAEIGANNTASEDDFSKLKEGYKIWDSKYVVNYLGIHGAACFFFVGECLYKSGLITNRTKYISAQAIRNTRSIFAEVPKDKIAIGDIVSFYYGGSTYHVEVVTKIEKGGYFSADSFSSRGAGRSIRYEWGGLGKRIQNDGIEKGDTIGDKTREIYNSPLDLKFLRVIR